MGPAIPFWKKLTPRQKEVACLVLDGLSNPEVGERLGISPATAKIHLKWVFFFAEVRSRQELREHYRLRGGRIVKRPQDPKIVRLRYKGRGFVEL